MNKSKICINLFRISSDSKNLDMIFNCPNDYYFNSLQLEVRFLENNAFKSMFFDLSNALFSNNGTPITDKYEWTVRLPLDKLGIQVPAIYIGTFKIQSDSAESDDCTCLDGVCLEDTAVCSDVNYAYKCMLKDLLELTDPCPEISDELVRKYLLLYGHQAAMSSKDFEIAEEFFRHIVNCFGNCPGYSPCGCKKPKKSGCNCGSR